MAEQKATPVLDIGEYKYGFHDPENYNFKSGRGLNPEIVKTISAMKNEPGWMTDYRLKALEHFLSRPMPKWGARECWRRLISTTSITTSNHQIAAKDRGTKCHPISRRRSTDWESPKRRRSISREWARNMSRKSCTTVCRKWEELGVLFLDTESGLRDHEDIFKEYFGKVIPYNDNKFAALNSAVWSGGSFIYVPPGVTVDIPLQAYFRINSENMGQFERTLIIVDEGACVHYVEGCTAPTYSSDSLHSAVVEIIVKEGGRCTYTTIQNWSNNVYNLVTKRAYAYENATMEWVDCNLGSKLTMKYPSIYLMGEGAKGEVLSVAFAGDDQLQDAGAKMLHFAKNTSSKITSKSISKGSGRASYRGLIKVAKGCTG